MMKASSLTVATSVVVLVLATHEPTLSSGLSVGEGGHYASSRRHVMTAHPLSMQSSKFLHWQKKPLPEYFSQMSSWEEQQREQHPVNSSELWGPFSYSEEEERALERHLAVEESEWNAKHGGIGGRPRPRYCVIDEEWRGSTHADQDFSPEGFRRALRAALNLGRLSDFLVCDRYQEPRGHDVLTGKPLAMNLTSSYSCPALRTYTRADWACSMVKSMGQRNGLLKMDMPFKDVRTMRFATSSLMEPSSPEELSNFDEIFFRRGPLFHHCHEGSCDCDRVFKEHQGHFPAACDMRKLLLELEPYREAYARQQITLAFSLYDLPWLTASNVSVIDPRGRVSLLSFDLPAQLVQSNWFGRIFYEGKRDRLPGIDTYPKMFSSAYMEGREQLLVETILNADLESKRGVLAAWGQRHGKTARSDASAALNDFAARYDWVEHRMIPADHYWPELAKYRFLMAPRGNGLQAPKFMEALALMTIPITKRYACFEDLQMYGFPLVIVDDWDEITPKALEYWWEKLSPRLEEARWLVTHYGLNSLLYGDCD